MTHNVQVSKELVKSAPSKTRLWRSPPVRVRRAAAPDVRRRACAREQPDLDLGGGPVQRVNAASRTVEAGAVALARVGKDGTAVVAASDAAVRVAAGRSQLPVLADRDVAPFG